MKMIRNLSLLIPSALILVACNNSEVVNAATEDDQSLNEPIPVETYTYTAVVDAEYPPYGLRNEYGNADGFDVDILMAIAENQDFSVKVLPKNWDSVLSSMNQGTYQIAMGGILEADIKGTSHEENYTYSVPYIYGHDAIATLPSTTNIKSFEDLADQRVGVLADSGHVDLVTNLQAESGGELKEANSTFLALKSLFLNEVDAVLADQGVLLYAKNNNTETEFDIHQEGEKLSESFEMVYMINKENAELNEKIKSGIEQIVADGTYQDIYQKWFGVAPDMLPSS